MRYLDNISIPRKIGGGFAVVLTLLIVLGGFGAYSVDALGGLFSDYRRLARSTVETDNVRANLLETRLALRTFLENGSSDAAENVRRRGEAAIASVGATKALTENTANRAVLDGVENDFRDYLSAFDGLVEKRAVEMREYDRINEIGDEIGTILTDVMQGTYRAADAVGAYDAGVALRSLLMARLFSMKFLFAKVEADRVRAVEELAALKKDLETLHINIMNPARRGQIQEAIDLATQYAEHFDVMVEATMGGNAIVGDRIDVLDPQIATAIDAYAAAAQAHQDELGLAAVATIDRTMILTIVFAGLALVVGAAASFAISRRISRPVSAMTQAMQRLAEKDLDVEVPATGQRDEIGAMAQAVLVFKENMARAAALAAEQEKEQHAREERVARIETLNREFDRSIGTVLESVGTAVGELQSTAKGMSSIAEETNAQASAVAAASEQSATSVHAVSTSAEELSSSIQEIARQIAHSSALTGDASNRAVETQGVVSGLSSSVDRIGDIVKLITDIAEQTNLLALNATIEAARAGEAGKGFAVVATEVKNLATQTAKATEEISHQIGEVQAETRRAVPAIDEIVKAIGEVAEVASSIASAVEEQSAATGEIAQNVQQVASGSSEISENISGMSRASGEASGAAAEVLSSSERLSQQSAQLRDLVGHFIENVRAA